MCSIQFVVLIFHWEIKWQILHICYIWGSNRGYQNKMHLVMDFIDLIFLVLSYSVFKASYILDQGENISSL